MTFVERVAGVTALAPIILRNRRADPGAAHDGPSRFAAALLGALLVHGGVAAAVWPRAADDQQARDLRGGEAVEIAVVAFNQADSVAQEAAPAPPPAASEPIQHDPPAPQQPAPRVEAREDAMAPLAPVTESVAATPKTPPRPAATSQAPGASATRPRPADPPKVRRAEKAEPPHPSGQGAERRQSAAAARGGLSGAPDAAGAAEARDWRGEVLARLARFKQYPGQAQDHGSTGKAILSFTLAPGGALRAVALLRSSGSALLDEATLAMARRAAPFPPAPPGARLSFTALINYDLR